MTNTTDPPGGLHEQTPDWHFRKIVEFTSYKKQIGEPSPHLAMMGYMTRDEDILEKAWRLGCYAAAYSLPTAQVIWTYWDHESAQDSRDRLNTWIEKEWKGIVTRTERRCVRTHKKFNRCLNSYLDWLESDFPRLQYIQADNAHEYYDLVWKSVSKVYSFGRYINIRLIEGLRRYCGVPAALYDIRSVGGWSPKKALVYFYPKYADILLKDDKEGNELTEVLSEELLQKMKQFIPTLDHYVIAAMLCEYREAFEDRHQYPGWTIDQEPIIYNKVKNYWGDLMDDTPFYNARSEIFPKEALGEFSGWNGTRWELTKTLRNYGYIWSDLIYDYNATLDENIFVYPVRRVV